jgi:hypothetical protein
MYPALQYAPRCRRHHVLTALLPLWTRWALAAMVLGILLPWHDLVANDQPPADVWAPATAAHQRALDLRRLLEESSFERPVEPRIPAPLRSPLMLPHRAPDSQFGLLGDWRHNADVDYRSPDGLRAHWVSLSASGHLAGRINVFSSQGELVPAQRVNLAFSQSGRVVARAVSGDGGRFEIRDVVPGVYAVVASGQNGFAACSLIVLPPSRPRTDRSLGASESLDERDGLGEEVQLEMAAVGPTYRTIQDLLATYYPRMKDFRFGPEVYDQLQDGLNREAPQYFGFRELREAPTSSPAASTVRTRPVTLAPDGMLRGRVVGMDPLSGRPRRIRHMDVFIIHHDRIMARASVDNRGSFQIRGLSSGAHGLVAAGPDGFGAMAFELVEAEAVFGPTAGLELQPVSWHNPETDSRLSLAVVSNPRDLASGVNDGGPLGTTLAEGVRDGGGGLGAGGGGGVGSGGGSVGGIGTAAAAAALIGAAATNQDGDGTRSPASPTAPQFDP